MHALKQVNEFRRSRTSYPHSLYYWYKFRMGRLRSISFCTDSSSPPNFDKLRLSCMLSRVNSTLKVVTPQHEQRRLTHASCIVIDEVPPVSVHFVFLLSG